MNILLESRAFYPSIGGLEMMAQELARKWQHEGHSVRVMTATRLGDHAELEDLEVLRTPSSPEWLRQMRWADVFVQNGVSLRSVGYAILSGCPIVFRHPDVLRPNDGGIDLRNELKRWATTLGANIASSQAVAEPIRGKTVRVPNTVRPMFQSQLEDEQGDDSRSGLLFVGRLVSVKGADLAIDALRMLRDRGVDQSLTVCGDGPERNALEDRVRRRQLTDAVTFEGWTDPKELVDHYSSAELTLVPSRYEPFGIVALEALACGCPVVAASVQGLPEAVGPCGLLVEPEDPEALANAVERALRPNVRNELRAAMPDHIEQHRLERVAREYLDVIKQAAHEA